MKRHSAAVDGYEAGCDWDVSSYGSWKEVLADKDAWPQGNAEFMRGVRAALSDRASDSIDPDACARGPMSRENPDSALTLAEAGIIQDVLLLTLGAGLLGIAGYLIWQKYGVNADQTPAQATSEIYGYTPSPATSTTIPNPSQLSDQNGVTPWVPPGPAA